MQVERIAKGLWRWTAPHPEWTEDKGGPGGWERDVASVYVEGDDAVVLIDPLVPGEGADRARFFGALDRDLDRLPSLPLAIVVSCVWHRRSAADLAARYASRKGTVVLAHAEAGPFLSEIEVRPFRETDPLPGGLAAFRAEGTDPLELVLHVPRHETLVAADVLLGAGEGALRLCPPAWLAEGLEGRDRHETQLRPSLRRLLALPISRVLPSHGAPVLENGRDALAAALDAPPWGE